MSALDQAFIKAYGKPTARPPAAGVAPAAAATEIPPAARSGAAPTALPPATAAIERLYSDGSLYRIDLPAAAATGVRRAASSAVPAPHLALPPPTSPKRGMRRSVLRLLASQPEEIPAPESPTSSRVQRKVIIRHVSHVQPAAGLIPPPHIAPHSLRTELAPEFATEPPADRSPHVDKPTLPPAPEPAEAAPHNALDFVVPSALVQAEWHGESAVAPLVVLSEPTDLAGPETLVSVQWESLPEPPTESAVSEGDEALEPASPVIDAAADEEAPARFPAKSLDDDRRTSVRVDPPHAASSRRPHIHFPPPAELTPEEAESLTADLPTILEPVGLQVDIEEPAVDAAIEEPFAEVDQAPARPLAAAVWEVDQFKWPRVCERLLTDDQGYLAGAGDKLLAAVRDGLKTLAVTGSRRGEGRTTLALCLARVAARAGIQVAVLDADFARPQIASRLGLEISHGWQDAATGSIPLSEAAIKSLQDNVTVLPLEITAIRRTLSLADPRVTSVLRQVASSFELVIVDLGPLAPGEEMAFPLGEACPLDAVIVVRDLRFATAMESQDVGERLHDAGIEAVGIAENFVSDAA